MVGMDVRGKGFRDMDSVWQNEIQDAIAMDVAELAILKDGFAPAEAMSCFRNSRQVENLIPEAFLHEEAPRGDEKRKQH